MKTVLLKEIDGYNVISGMDIAIIDPVATKEAILNKRRDAIQAIVDEIRSKQIAVIKARSGNKATLEKSIAELEMSTNKLPALCEISRHDMIENAIYFEPKRGEVIISDELSKTILEKLKALKPNIVMVLDNGTVNTVPNHRGTKYWIKEKGRWSFCEVKSIGIELPDKANVEITDTDWKEIQIQDERDRIDGLSPEEKNLEKERCLNEAIVEANNKRSQYEILGEKDSLEKSKQFYQQRIKEIESKYR